MRVIAGELRHRLLQAPKGTETRPTTDRLRETLFNILQPRVQGCWFLDLYAGSGANGIEALSRGAAGCVWVEQAKGALEALDGNLRTLGLAGKGRVERRAVGPWLRRAAEAAQPGSFDIVFLDPPYDRAEEYGSTLGLLGGEAGRLLAPGAVVVAEHRRARRGAPQAGAAPPAERYGALERWRVVEQGDAALSFFAGVAR